MVMKRSITPALTLDPAPPVIVPPRPSGLLLADGSRVQARIRLSDLGSSYGLQMWLVRILPDGSFDPQFGGGGDAVPSAISRWINRAGFRRTDTFDGGRVHALPAGGYTAILRTRWLPPLATVSVPTGILATRWDADGMPHPSWGDGVLDADFVVVKEVLVDHPTRIVVIGAVEEPRAQGSRTPAILGLRTSDGARDPTFGVQGQLLVSLRRTELWVAQATIRRPDGTTVLPVRADDEGKDRFPGQGALIWLEVI